ncbi:Gfo/Idh/MocA family protein [Actinokineospora pegani]|uniref:Gfo/Idh/MocA family protein n=1 Tax=Actinokineospora pegani TaxID=2654637 RepID=UPI0012EA09B7|nr:Gfo/Idh/MocA family oxidoreductase [Actinokineospora pegani]
MKIAVLSFDEDYVRLLAEMPGVEVVVAGPDDRVRAAADRLGVAHVDSWDEVFALRPRAVVVTSEVARRRDLVERAAGVGAQVLCEHPLAVGEADAQAMVDACAAAGVRLTVASPACFSPAFAVVRQGIADSGVGELLTVHGAFNSPGRSRGGALDDHAPYVLDLVDAVLGGEVADQVYAQANSIVSGQPGTESAAFVSVRYPSGVVAAIDCSWGPSVNQRAGDTPEMTFVGDQGSVEFTANPRLLGGFDRWEAKTDPRSVMLTEFVAAVAEGRAVGPDGAAGVRALRVVRAARESARTGRPVDL